MKTDNARPFDPNNRPLKGEWVILSDGDADAIPPPPTGDIDHGYTQGLEAVKRVTPDKKPVSIGLIVVCVIALGALAFVVMSMMGGKEKPTSPDTSSKSVSTAGKPADGPPELSLIDSKTLHAGEETTYVFKVDLHVEGATLDTQKPVEHSIKGRGEVKSMKFENGELTLVVKRNGAGELHVSRLNFASGSATNAANPKMAPIKWGAK